MGTIWELDFYSRPILDTQQKKLWEVLICNRQLTFQFAKYCSGAEANARWLMSAIQEAVQQWQQEFNLPESERPERIRFFRRPMNSIILRGCEAAGIPGLASRRTFGLYEWLAERQEQVYPQTPGYQPLIAPPPELPQAKALPLPDALQGQKWQFVSLPVAEFANATEWEIKFGEVFSLSGLDPESLIPGIIIYSQRALPLAAWMSGLEPACLSLELGRDPQMVLETGADDRWTLVTLPNQDLITAAEAFIAAQAQVKNLHFLAVQASPEREDFAGFWLMQAWSLV
ncbi:Tab2/Atab2 family RNA-binding protein [Thermosynechococcaceae cyanobacterium BACA0444]|uniref:Tab2/Atab2 family RNA-binding protein n=1 Tax=Pseudocalidococcus azoricus BACA0444 TaxID=2918990 RepID=A0AAE4FQZ1_9CYAN|nr:Tab2/Atab2 family RNA-binding protein [Pseudocalidococcus azoricus]MDS3859667.1 Tab2/Atab2 family RNA-binding protein [Pseudocalidococcus azoricus BACA0444]